MVSSKSKKGHQENFLMPLLWFEIVVKRLELELSGQDFLNGFHFYLLGDDLLIFI